MQIYSGKKHRSFIFLKLDGHEKNPAFIGEVFSFLSNYNILHHTFIS